MPSAFRPQRIVIVSDAWRPQVNGVVTTLENTARALSESGHSVEIVGPDRFRTVPCPGYTSIRLALTTPSGVAKVIDALRPDALHIATEGPLGWAARRVALRRGWGYTTAYHTRFPEYLENMARIPAAWTYYLIRRFHRPSAAMLAPTPSIAAHLRERDFARVAEWSRGVDTQIFYPPRKGDSRPKRESPVFLYAGRISTEKNLEAFLSLELPGQIWVAGDGPARAGLEARFPKARFLGMQTPRDLADIYRQASVFVFPSRTDTFGLVLLEAMACGLPVAAFPVPGPLDVVGGKPAGILDEDLQRACLGALKLGSSGPLARAASFGWERASRQFLDALVPLVPDTADSTAAVINCTHAST